MRPRVALRWTRNDLQLPTGRGDGRHVLCTRAALSSTSSIERSNGSRQPPPANRSEPRAAPRCACARRQARTAAGRPQGRASRCRPTAPTSSPPRRASTTGTRSTTSSTPRPRRPRRCAASSAPPPPASRLAPSTTDIPGALWLPWSRGDFDGAANIFRETSELPEMCGRLCPQERLLRKATASVGKKGITVAIGKLESFVTEHQHAHGKPRPRPRPPPPTGKARRRDRRRPGRHRRRRAARARRPRRHDLRRVAGARRAPHYGNPQLQAEQGPPSRASSRTCARSASSSS